MWLRYNSPVILTFALISTVVLAVDTFSGQMLIRHFFSTPLSFNFFSPLDYFNTVSYIIGHGGWNHLYANFLFILLLGPSVEEKYGSGRLILMIVITAAVTAFLHSFFFSGALIGASGIVFMLIVLAAFGNVSSKEIPLTFVLVAVLFLTKEVISALSGPDNISQFGHVLGGILGGIFGFTLPPRMPRQ